MKKNYTLNLAAKTLTITKAFEEAVAEGRKHGELVADLSRSQRLCALALDLEADGYVRPLCPDYAQRPFEQPAAVARGDVEELSAPYFADIFGQGDGQRINVIGNELYLFYRRNYFFHLPILPKVEARSCCMSRQAALAASA